MDDSRLIVETQLIRDGDLPTLHQLHPGEDAICLELWMRRSEKEECGYGQYSAMRLVRFLRGAISENRFTVSRL